MRKSPSKSSEGLFLFHSICYNNCVVTFLGTYTNSNVAISKNAPTPIHSWNVGAFLCL
uniref:Uncharacterized protein n=1 Tax=Siphoviridae sp. ctwNf2 TaxID=2827597 RepID=A0A8S5RRY1_9CAUD|nr:MAG TPA: hypothetical protein [Siphoviridae sp. ctwNf2]